MIFKNLNDIENDDSAYENKMLQEHGELVMSAIDKVISNIQHVDDVLQHMNKVGMSHCRFSGFTSDLFYVSPRG